MYSFILFNDNFGINFIPFPISLYYNFKKKIPARIITIIENNKLNNSNSLIVIINSINNNIDFTSIYLVLDLR